MEVQETINAIPLNVFLPPIDFTQWEKVTKKAGEKGGDYVKGLINLRGQIVTVIDLRRRLGFESLENGTKGMNLIVQTDEGLMSVSVDQIGNVLDLRTDRLKPAPGTIRGVAVHYIQAVCQLEEDLLIVLDIDSILQLTQS